jgi:hypothetical protein
MDCAVLCLTPQTHREILYETKNLGDIVVIVDLSCHLTPFEAILTCSHMIDDNTNL